MVERIFGGRIFSGQNVRQRKKGKKAPNRPTIYVRRNGSRYIDMDELVASDEFQETLKQLKDIDLKQGQRADK